MATARKPSRTATTEWRKTRDYVRRNARREGVETCPICGTRLNWDRGQQPNSAEVDHIIPHSLGGSDHPTNLRIVCRTCNQSRGNGAAPKPKRVQSSAPLVVSRRH